MEFDIPYNSGSHQRRYVPDFIVRIDDGAGPDDPLNLILEVKGYRYEDVKDKSDTMRVHWVPGVNNLGTYGRWAFHEFAPSVYEMQKEFDSLTDRLSANGVQDMPSRTMADFLGERVGALHSSEHGPEGAKLSAIREVDLPTYSMRRYQRQQERQ